MNNLRSELPGAHHRQVTTTKTVDTWNIKGTVSAGQNIFPGRCNLPHSTGDANTAQPKRVRRWENPGLDLWGMGQQVQEVVM